MQKMIQGREGRTAAIITAALLTVISLAAASRPAGAEDVSVSYLYNLSDFTGIVPSSWPTIFTDESHKEVYVIYQGIVRVFNDNGMEVYRFGDDENLGSVFDATLDKDGNILLLSYTWKAGKAHYDVILCNYRGEPVSRFQVKNLPAEFTDDFYPNFISYRGGRLYLADKGSMRVAVTDMQGVCQKSYDLLKVIDKKEKDRHEIDINGFYVDSEENILFTIPVLFKAFVLSPTGKLAAFGQRGSIPGKFNIVSGITSDEKGNYFVADSLKSVVMVFDKDFKFIKQFGYRGNDRGNLMVPLDLVIQNNKLYVTQSAERGVSVFSIAYN